MGMIKEIDLDGGTCWRLENEWAAVWLSAEFGPRVLGYSLSGGVNLLASLPNATLPTGDGRHLSLRGGHRLWYAPERPETTYIPDERPPRIRELEGGLEFIQEIDQPTGIQKSWRIELAPESAQVVIDHRLTNFSTKPYELAPWAVTMLRTGGVGLLPLQVDQDDAHGLWPNRQLVLWPYTDIRSDQLLVHNRGVFVAADLKEGALKVGAPNPSGDLAYRHNGVLFSKKSKFYQGEKYPDRGASHQIFCSPDVIELETLGPLTILEPGEKVSHQEVWMIYPEGAWPERYRDLFARVDI